MSFVHRPYDELVADVLTTLTAGIAEEVHSVPADAPANQPLDITLARRPVRRVSLVRGFLPAPVEGGEPVRITFQLGDYQLIGSPDDASDLSTIRFQRPDRRPASGTDLRINYYPRTAEPAPITDVNVGSVARTLVEAVGREIAQLYAQLNLAYEAGFLETAQGSALDRVVALVAQRRARAGRAVGTVQFRRRPGSVGNITIPVGTPVTDGQDSVRYETVEQRQMLAGESVADVRIAGASPLTPVVEADVLAVVQRAIAGIDSVSNPRPTTRASADESDDDLRRRVAGAVGASVKGTLAAMKNGLLMLPDVRGVSIEEEPNGVPGEIRVSVSLAEGDTLPPAVLNRIEELRPAGIRVIREAAGALRLTARLDLLVAGPPLPDTEMAAIRTAAATALVDRVGRLGVGETVRVGPLIGAVLADTRLADVTITLALAGAGAGTPGADLPVPAGQAVVLGAEDVTLGAVAFSEAPAGAAVAEPLAASLSLTAAAVGATGQAAIQAAIETRFADALAAVAAGDTLDAEGFLTALRDDSSYAIDTASLVVTVTGGDQFVQITTAGGSLDVTEGMTLAAGQVEVTLGEVGL